MQRRSFFWIVFLIVSFSFLSLACSALGGGAEEASTVELPAEAAAVAETVEDSLAEEVVPQVEVVEPDPTTEPKTEAAADTSAEEEAGTEGAAESGSVSSAEPQAKSIAVSDLAEPDDFNSYEMLMNISMTAPDEDGVDVEQSIMMTVATSVDPEIMSVSMSAPDLADGMEFGEMSMVLVDGVTYMTVPGFGCISTTEEDNGGEDPFADITDTSAFMGDIGAANYVGNEVINGIDTYHYEFDESAIEDDTSEIVWLDGHVYVAQEGGFLVRMFMEGEGIFEGIGDEAQYGTMAVQFDILSINEPVEVIIPEDCDTFDLGGDGSDSGDGDADAGGADWPVLSDAMDVSSFAGIFTYTTVTPFDEIVAFYRDSLTAAGWIESEDEAFVFEDTALLTFTQDDLTINVTITKEDPEGDVSTVLIFDQ